VKWVAWSLAFLISGLNFLLLWQTFSA
jgi:hypothetical protein